MRCLRAVAALCLAVAPTGAAHAQERTAGVIVVDSRYIPLTIRVVAPTKVVWEVRGNLQHSVTADDGSFDSSPSCPPDCLEKAQKFTHVFDKPGRYVYHCRIHGQPDRIGMFGVVTVVENTGTPAGAAPSGGGGSPVPFPGAGSPGETLSTAAPGSAAPSLSPRPAPADGDANSRTSPAAIAIAVAGALALAAVGAFAWRRRGSPRP